MYNITLIGTIHSKKGKCNSDELYKIIELINPEVIFDERPSNCNPETLEAKCIEKYKQKFYVEIISVDIYVKPKLEVLYMFDELIKHSEEYKEIINKQELLIEQKGFDYLNSDIFFDLFEKKINKVEQLVTSNEFFKEKLLYTYNLYLEEIDNRENTMLQNIYNYSKENQFNQAVFLIGADHRKSIMKKILEYEKLSEIKLNWTKYNSKFAQPLI